MFNKRGVKLKMVKTENNPNIQPTEVIEVPEIVVSNDQFDLTVLKTDLENAEREAKAAINQNIIDQANIQKDAENLQKNIENFQSINEAFKELLEFGFSFLNKSLEKVDVSTFDSKFIDEFMERLMKVIPKDQVKNFQRIIGLTDKTNTSIQLLKIGKFLMFVIQELYTRFDEYRLYRKLHEKPPLKFQIPKKAKPEV